MRHFLYIQSTVRLFSPWVHANRHSYNVLTTMEIIFRVRANKLVYSYMYSRREGQMEMSCFAGQSVFPLLCNWPIAHQIWDKHEWDKVQWDKLQWSKLKWDELKWSKLEREEIQWDELQLHCLNSMSAGTSKSIGRAACWLKVSLHSVSASFVSSQVIVELPF